MGREEAPLRIVTKSSSLPVTVNVTQRHATAGSVQRRDNENSMTTQASIAAPPMGPATRREWARRIVEELARLQLDGGVQQLIWFNELGVTMLDTSDSCAGVQWLEAVEDLRRQGVISIDAAGYVTLTARGRARAHPPG